jgi:SWI/SNF-related matrix-associated actin-dependent regulator of chromatin subfamily A-like protein 1
MKLNINGNKAEVTFDDYQFEAYQEAKMVRDAVYNMNNDSWSMDKQYAKDFLQRVGEFNIDIQEAMSIVKSNIDNHSKVDTENVNNSNDVIKTVSVKVKENSKSLTLSFDYDDAVRLVINDIESKVYNPKNKTYRIDKSEVEWLYVKLLEMDYVDADNLKPFTSYADREEITVSADNFPHSSIKPYPFQLDTVKQLLERKKIINALEAGLGKTAITVMACEYLQKKTVIVCPASVKENWKKEIHQINPNADVSVLYSDEEYKSAQYVVLNYDIMNKFIDNLLNDGFEVVAFDEAHKLRGVSQSGKPSSQRAKLAIKLADNMDYVFPITATPFVNQTKDIFNLLNVIDHPLGSKWWVFANTYCAPEKTAFGTTFKGSSNQEQLNKRLYPNSIVRIKTEDHIELPDRTRSFIPVKINMNKYNKQIKSYMDNRQSLEDNGKHLVELTIMRQTLAKEKAKEAVKMIKDYLDQEIFVVVFSNYTDVVYSIADKFKDDSVVITGDVDSKERQKAVEQFQSGKKKVFVGNIDAAGEGITLTKSHQMIVVDMHWSPVVMVNQMEKRIHRISQTQPVNVQYLYCEEASIDQGLLKMLESKLSDSSLILDGKKEDFFTDSLIKDIF